MPPTTLRSATVELIDEDLDDFLLWYEFAYWIRVLGLGNPLVPANAATLWPEDAAPYVLSPAGEDLLDRLWLEDIEQGRR
jgi:hypothetical protein